MKNIDALVEKVKEQSLAIVEEYIETNVFLKLLDVKQHVLLPFE